MGKSDWTKTNVQKREVQHTHAGPEVTGPPKSKSKKKKFCKSNKWQKHEVELKKYYSWWYELTCVHCGKRFWYSDLQRHANIVVFVSEHARLVYEAYKKDPKNIF